ncbi:hypothetical protein [Flavobacterium sp.]|uniref:hypothetical protein n=1 Tax=Flavobacterium sp. TaxID=239 RepID=UPI0039E6B3CD
MEFYATLTEQEKNKLIQFPVYISLLAANQDGQLDDKEKQKANEVAHIKKYENKEPLLVKFYEDVEAQFASNLDALDAQLPHDKDQREAAIRQQLGELEGILSKLSTQYNNAMHRSIQTFKEYVSKAHENVLEHFIFPFPIKGFTE